LHLQSMHSHSQMLYMRWRSHSPPMPLWGCFIQDRSLLQEHNQYTCQKVTGHSFISLLTPLVVSLLLILFIIHSFTFILILILILIPTTASSAPLARLLLSHHLIRHHTHKTNPSHLAQTPPHTSISSHLPLLSYAHVPP